jgi:bifunctional non-homologous end joining protein LigD
MSLTTYKKKRDFKKTPEPAGNVGRAPKGNRRFVVQRHRATRLHFDFRLEIDGVLMSWAVPKGPSLNPGERRMAVHVEDHPLEYFDFEGIIPKGEYGGGDVIVWDWGTWEPEETDDPGKAVRSGELKFALHGQKLQGRFTIVKMRGGNLGRDEDAWLLIHKKDDFADESWDVDDHPQSVKTGRTNDEVKAGAPAVWDSRAPAESATIDLAAARKSPMPDFIEPMKATLADKPFSDPDWLFELKLDGYRVEAVVRKGRVKLWTRNQQDAARYFPDLADEVHWIAAQEAIVDGEVVAIGEDGEPSFSLLQDRTGVRAGAQGVVAPNRRMPVPPGEIPIVYYVFDLLYLDGQLLIDVPLEERKRLLRMVLREHSIVKYASHIPEEGEAMYRAAKQRNLEGLVAKERRSRYEPGRRSRSWLKLKIRREQELVVAGYVPGKGSHKDLGSLIVGVHDDGKFVHAGEVGSGINTRTRAQLVKTLDELRRDTAPFDGPAPRIKDARWADPKIVIRAEFSEWTTDDLLRQAAFKGLDPEKDPREVVRERPVRAESAVDEAERASARASASSKRSKSAAKPAAVKAPPNDAGKRPSRTTSVSTSDGRARASTGTRAARAPESDARETASGSDVREPRSRSKRHGAYESDLPDRATPDEIEELQRLGKQGRWSVGGHDISLTNLDKPLFPPLDEKKEKPITKRELIRYFAEVAPYVLPHLRARPLNLHRYPDGAFGNGFWQKETPKYAPDWIRRWRYEDAAPDETHYYMVADQVGTLAWLANHAAFEIHAWTSRLDRPHRPTYALIDIDPGEKTTFDELLVMARLYRSALEHLGVTGFPKLSGRRGIQIWVPIKRKYTYDQTRDWVGEISKAVGAAVPDLVSWEWEKGRRRGLARLDYTQNAINKTLVAPYAVRPASGAPVSAPLRWAELDDPELRPNRWTIRNILPRVQKEGDLFVGALENEQELPPL